jgi:hypothetical protein
LTDIQDKGCAVQQLPSSIATWPLMIAPTPMEADGVCPNWPAHEQDQVQLDQVIVGRLADPNDNSIDWYDDSRQRSDDQKLAVAGAW